MSLTVAQKKRIDLAIGSPLIVVLKALAHWVGLFVRREHELRPRGTVYFLKLMGGGSLVIAAPAIIGIRKRYPDIRLGLITTPSVAPFGKILGAFDEIQIVDDRTIGRLLVTSLRTLKRIFRADTVIDLEVYSRLSSVFSLLACARNRIGFYTETSFWRSGISTHLLFFNRTSGTFVFYDQMARLLDAAPSSPEECRAVMKISRRPRPQGQSLVVGVGHGCSNLCMERMLSEKQWVSVLSDFVESQLRQGEHSIELRFFGVKNERELAQRVIEGLRQKQLPGTSFLNRSGELSLDGTIEEMSVLDRFFSIDSSLVHIARLLELDVTSFWGPTDPKTLLRPVPGLSETVHYAGISCSPCVHVTETPPCRGANVCMSRLFAATEARPDPLWLMET